MKHIINICILLLLCACSSHPEVPAVTTTVDTTPKIFPDYRNVTVPINIAPLNFMSADSLCTEIIARLTSAEGKSWTYGKDRKVIIDNDEWTEMLSTSAGKEIKVEVFGLNGETKEWTAYKPFEFHVAEEPIDDYISYRLIQPSYVLYDRMNISQRNLTNFEESEIFNNKATNSGGVAQCINCHSYQNYSTDNMLFHVRVTHGGTVLVVDGKPRKVNLKRDNTISAGVYPAWHPTERLIAFSTNLTAQFFFTSHPDKTEVFDKASDLILYDIDSDEVSIIANDTTRLEVFPTWSPDGKYLYYCSADTWKKDETSDFRYEYDKLHYNLYRRSFDITTKCFGEEELVYDAEADGGSVSLPRVSPDGKYIAFAEGPYGCFNIWHHDSDIRVMNLESDTTSFVDTRLLNSRYNAESYPSWSSNGKWIMCASRRDDGNYSRVYISYFDGERIHRAFEIPQADPENNTRRLRSYNRPEFMIEKVKLSEKDFVKVVKD